jgi:hypothetical protein
MENNTLTPKSRLASLKPKHWALIGLGAVVVLILASSGGSGVDPDSWDCESIKDAAISTSRGEDLEIVEIGRVVSETQYAGTIRCVADGTWKQGVGRIGYGAEVSDQGNIIISINRS